MKPSIVDSRKSAKKSRGRPTTGIGKAIGLRLYPELERAVEAYEQSFDDPPSRPEAIRQLVTESLKRKKLL